MFRALIHDITFYNVYPKENIIKIMLWEIRNKHKVCFRLSNSGTGMSKTNKKPFEENWWNLVPQLAQKGFDMDD